MGDAAELVFVFNTHGEIFMVRHLFQKWRSIDRYEYRSIDRYENRSIVWHAKCNKIISVQHTAIFRRSHACLRALSSFATKYILRRCKTTQCAQTRVTSSKYRGMLYANDFVTFGMPYDRSNNRFNDRVENLSDPT